MIQSDKISDVAYTFYAVTCGACKREFSTRDHRQRACSKKCAGIMLFPDPSTRFWAKVKRTDSCWLWTGSLNPQGYGIIRISGKPIKTHRWSYENTHGPITGGLFVCHRCDVRNCVNPAHLFLGTKSDNAIDMHQKGRNFLSQGEKNGVAKLTAEQVREIRTAAGTLKSIGERFGVSLTAIHAIKTRQRWKHVA